MNGYDVYREYIAIKAHFNTNYNYFEYQGKVRTKRSSYEKRNDKKFFEILAKKGRDYVRQFMISQFVHSPTSWIGDFVLNQEAVERYVEWKKRTTNIYKTAYDELLKIRDFIEAENLSIKDLFDCKSKKKLPIIFRLMTEGYISYETFIVIMTCYDFMPLYSKTYSDNLVFEKYRKRIEDYRAFLKPDRNKALATWKKAFGG